MGGKYPAQRAAGTGRIFLALLCILLVAVAGTVQAAHTHTGLVDTHADCSLCAAAHVTIDLVSAPAPAPAVAVVAVVETPPAPTAPSVVSTFALFTRPPPAV